MRTFSGYISIFMLIPFLAGLLFFITNEWTQAESFHSLINKKMSLKEIRLPQTSQITAGDGSVITDLHNSENRIFVTGKQIPEFLKQIFVTIEDRHFYEHSGLDVAAVSRAVLANSKSESPSQGGSTITQQLARNLYLTHDKTYNRKLTELLYSYALEKKLSKQQILELYMNAIYFQNGAYGVEAASRMYFHKGVKQLSRAQLSFLAAIPNNPVMYDPLTHFEAAKKRQERILNQLLGQKIISAEEFKTIRQAPIVLNISHSKDLYPDYSSYAEKEFRDLVATSEGYIKLLEDPSEKIREKYSLKLNKRVNDLLDSGITIHTALDKKIQGAAVKSINTHLPEKGIEGAAVVIEHHTHELVSLIGGKDYKKYSFNRAFQSYRQPGSAIKPLLVYGPYIETHNPDLSQKISADNFCKQGYCPHNYGNVQYGSVPIDEAFANSYNTPAIRLFNETGIQKSFSYLRPFHFKKITRTDYGLPAAVGGFTFGMSPLEMTNAFSSFHDGSYQPARAIRNVTDRNGKVLFRWKEKPVKAWNPQTVVKMRSLLNKAVIKGTGRKAYIPGNYIGGKTGTTNDFKDLWFVGLTENLTAGVWIGKDIPKSIENKKQESPQLLIWKDTVSSH